MSSHKRGRITVQNQPPKQTRIVRKLALVPFVVVSGLFVVIGLTQLGGTGLFGVVWTLMAVVFLIIGLVAMFTKTDLPQRVGYDVESDIREETIVGLLDDVDQRKPGSAPAAETHDHIPSMALDAKGRLEQLETLKEAGLLSDEEYAQKRKDILKDL